MGDAQEIIFVRADLPVMKEMLRLFGEVFEEPETYQKAVPSDEYLGSLLGSETFIPLAAIADGKVIGGLAAYVLRKFEQQRSEIYIYDLAVDENYRRRGVAAELLDKPGEARRQRGR